ncbi:MAG: tyrosine--tRNA ligase [Candidatus Ancillula sp.]|nr:tyrosine--tRNA ligase [Candidatus Ancillula sp.]
MKVNSDIFDELKWRGLVFQTTDESALRNALSSSSLKFYCGFDPTAPSLHHGNLVQLILMKHLQNAGHQPYCIIGGATGLIGDPRQSGERVLNDREVVESWGKNLTVQFKRFLSFEGDNAVQILNNYTWISSLSAIDFLRDVGKSFRVGTMLSKDTVKSRLDGEGLSFTEFSYQVLQGYDYYVLNRDHGITLQTGGQDQWGNLTSGLDLIHRLTDSSVHVLTTPLITKADGTKFGKSEGGAIWLSEDMMSAYEFYQFWLNVEDSEVVKLLKVFTFLGRPEIEELEVQVAENPGARAGQRRLAEEVTRLVHGEKALQQAIAASGALFGRGDLKDLDAKTLKAAVAGVKVGKSSVGERLADQFLELGLASSFSDFRKTFSAKGYYINNETVQDLEQVFRKEDVLPGGLVILRKGKKTVAAVEIGVENAG